MYLHGRTFSPHLRSELLCVCQNRKQPHLVRQGFFSCWNSCEQNRPAPQNLTSHEIFFSWKILFFRLLIFSAITASVCPAEVPTNKNQNGPQLGEADFSVKWGKKWHLYCLLLSSRERCSSENNKDCAVRGLQVQMDTGVERLYYGSEVISLFSFICVSENPQRMTEWASRKWTFLDLWPFCCRTYGHTRLDRRVNHPDQ